jgi:hypothetical protein
MSTASAGPVWSIRSLESRTADGFVCCAHYDCAFEGEVIYGSVGFPIVEDVSKVQLVPYEELSEALLIEWVKEALGETEAKAIEDELYSRAAEKVAPVMTTGVPWF